MTARIEALRARAERMDAARAYLEHVLAHHRDTSPDGCDHFEALIWGQVRPSPASLTTRGRGAAGMSAARDRTEP
ncbi:MAG TPA: hypothetical protein VHY31_05190 [Streptosporangiaceae bacterium]|nr:hypothetical protein [Streptosporangiaceae bacterium]